jgi:battenin
LVVAGFSLASFVTVAASHWLPMTLFGVACASFSSGLGEITFLSLTHYYGKVSLRGPQW